MPYVERDSNTHAIIGLYNLPQPGIAEEYLPDDNPEVQMFLHPQKMLVATSDLISRFTNAEYLKLEQKRAADIAATSVGVAKNWDILIADTNINVASQKAQTVKSFLVSAGIVTQTRADEIFTA